MRLNLTLQSLKDAPYPDQVTVEVNQQSVVIGRSDVCDLVLPDDEKVISRKHATIDFVDGHFVLTDHSLAGTYIGDSFTPLNNQSFSLDADTVLHIGDYGIKVTLISNDPAPFADVDSSPFGDVFTSDLTLQNQASQQSEDPLSASSGLSDYLQADESSSLLDNLNPFSSTPFPADTDTFEKVDNDLLETKHPEQAYFESELEAQNFSSLSDSFTPPEVTKDPSSANIPPEDFDFSNLFDLGAESEPHSQAIQPESKPALDSMPVIPEPEMPVEQPIEAISDFFQEDWSPENDKADESAPASLLDDLEDNEPSNFAPAPAPASPEPVSASLDSTSVPQKPRLKERGLLDSFCQGAGISSDDLKAINPEEGLVRVGQMFRQFVDNTVAVLRSRAEFKSLFRVSVTTIRKSDNNPLKFAVTTDEAMKHLLNDGQGGFKPALESIDEGFNDLLNHQLAMQAGIQASLQDILEQFNPQRIEKKFDQGLVLQKKSKCWEHYLEIYEQLTETAVDEFFGDAFSEAYEKQMQQLKNRQ